MCTAAPNQTYGHLISFPAESHAKGLQTIWAAIKHGAIKGRQRWWGWTESNPLLITDNKWVLPEDLNEEKFIGGFVPSYRQDAGDKLGAGQLNEVSLWVKLWYTFGDYEISIGFFFSQLTCTFMHTRATAYNDTVIRVLWHNIREHTQ